MNVKASRPRRHAEPPFDEYTMYFPEFVARLSRGYPRHAVSLRQGWCSPQVGTFLYGPHALGVAPRPAAPVPPSEPTARTHPSTAAESISYYTALHAKQAASRSALEGAQTAAAWASAFDVSWSNGVFVGY